MYGHTHRHPIVLHASRFRFAEQRLFFSRARLFPDRIELSGWLPGKRLTDCIRLDELKSIEWDAETSVATFHRHEAAPVRLRLPDLPRWRQSLEQRLTWSAPGRFPVAARTTAAPSPEWSLHDLVAFSTSMG